MSIFSSTPVPQDFLTTSYHREIRSYVGSKGTKSLAIESQILAYSIESNYLVLVNGKIIYKGLDFFLAFHKFETALTRILEPAIEE